MAQLLEEAYWLAPAWELGKNDGDDDDDGGGGGRRRRTAGAIFATDAAHGAVYEFDVEPSDAREVMSHAMRQRVRERE